MIEFRPRTTCVDTSEKSVKTSGNEVFSDNSYNTQEQSRSRGLSRLCLPLQCRCRCFARSDNSEVTAPVSKVNKERVPFLAVYEVTDCYSSD